MSNVRAPVAAGQVVKVIAPHSGWRLIDWRELYRYRDLFYFLVSRDIKVLYKQTVLGFAWAIIRPLFSMIIFTFIFGKLARIPSDGIPYPVFSYAALVPWTYFATAMSNSTTSLLGNVGLVTKVYFPRVVIPLSPVLAGLVDFLIALVMLFLLMLGFGIVPTWQLAFFPLLVLMMVLTAAGTGMWLSALAIQYRDVRFAIQFLSQILMYAAPVVWPVSLITEKLPVYGRLVRLAYGLYPMAGVVEGFRAVLLGQTPMPWDLIGIGTASATALFVSGLFYFRRMEKIFADVA